MKKLAITAALFAAFGISSVSAQTPPTQIGGNITFNGAVTNNTCDVSFSGDIDSFGADGRNPTVNLRQSFLVKEISADVGQGSATAAEARNVVMTINCNEDADSLSNLSVVFGSYEESTGLLPATGNTSVAFALRKGDKNNIGGAPEYLENTYTLDLAEADADGAKYTIPFFAYLVPAGTGPVVPGAATGVMPYTMSYD